MIGTIQCTDGYVVHANQNIPTGTRIPPAIAGNSRNSGGGGVVADFAARREYNRCQSGSVEIATKVPTKRPRNVMPMSWREKPWLTLKTSGKASKNRYRIPRRTAEKVQRTMHIGSRVRSWIGARQECAIVLIIDI
jgi:hypothetical protein